MQRYGLRLAGLVPPRWGERWGHDWEQHHQGWDHWDRNTPQTRAPLPVYQRQYSGNRYPRAVGGGI
jgi:hypothetical protein